MRFHLVRGCIELPSIQVMVNLVYSMKSTLDPILSSNYVMVVLPQLLYNGVHFFMKGGEEIESILNLLSCRERDLEFHNYDLVMYPKD